MKALAAHAALFGLLFVRSIGLGPHVRSTLDHPPSPTELADLWIEPSDLEDRDFFYGPWGSGRAPRAEATYDFVGRNTSGFSPGYDVKDSGGTEWSVKQGPEAQTDVVASRLLSAVGYHQPPVYYLPGWTLSGGPWHG